MTTTTATPHPVLTVSTPRLVAGDILLDDRLRDGRTIASINRNLTQLSAYVLRFEDGTHDFAHHNQVWHVRNRPRES
jgi:hypothetical protein